MSYTVETYLGVAILIPKPRFLSTIFSIESIGFEIFHKKEDEAFFYLIPALNKGENTKLYWNQYDKDEILILDKVSPKSEIAKFKRENKELISIVKNIAPDFQISFVFLTGGS